MYCMHISMYIGHYVYVCVNMNIVHMYMNLCIRIYVCIHVH